MKRVLFVDDEPHILDGLRNVLRRQRSLWDMEFVTSGAAALEALARRPADVVVSDMRMPGMDGAQLLAKIRDDHPATARIVLTGQASKSDLLLVLSVAQQILSKPCDPQALRASVERICKVQALLANAQLQALIGGVDSLPTFPECYQQLTAAMQREDASVAEIARIVERDPVLSAKALSLANSAYFGVVQSTTSIPAAVRHIGFSLLRALALSSGFLGRIDGALLASNTVRELPERALLRAQLAKRYVLDPAWADEAFTAGLLVDLGVVVLAQRQPQTYLPLLQIAESSARPLHELEREQLGFTHAEVGAYLLGVWGLPHDTVELVAAHHAPALLELSTNPVAAAVHIADVFTDPAQGTSEDPFGALVPSIRARPDVTANLGDWLTLAQQARQAA